MDKRMSSGTRVEAVIYGEKLQGTVTCRRSPNLVWIQWDGRKNVNWVHLESLTQPDSASEGDNMSKHATQTEEQS